MVGGWGISRGSACHETTDAYCPEHEGITDERACACLCVSDLKTTVDCFKLVVFKSYICNISV